jgi:8-oxo-dGTP pyrophosphatase MutT (NUDIX family)
VRRRAETRWAACVLREWREEAGLSKKRRVRTAGKRPETRIKTHSKFMLPI